MPGIASPAGLWLPQRGPIVPVTRPPSYFKLLIAFGLGIGATLFDKSRYRAHGSIEGADWATGAHGYALDFDSSVPDYVEIPAAYDHLDFTSEPFSCVARVYVDSLASSRLVVQRATWLTAGWAFYIADTGTLNLLTMKSTGWKQSNSGVGDISTGAWFTVGFSRSGTSVTLYKNGVDVTSTADTHADPDSVSTTTLIGIRDNLTGLPFDGKIEFLAIFGVSLATSEHLAWHNALA